MVQTFMKSPLLLRVAEVIPKKNKKKETTNKESMMVEMKTLM